MAALTEGRVKTSRVLQSATQTSGQKGSTTIYQGGIVMLDSSGYARPGATATGMIGAGVALSNGGLDRWANTGADGASDVNYDEGIFGPFINSGGGDALAAGDEGKPCYIVDDQTVAKTDNAGARSPAGRVHSVTTDGVYIEMSRNTGRQIAEEQVLSTGQAYTQTYSTANRTVANPTAATMTDNSTGAASTTVAAGVGMETIVLPVDLASITGAADVLTNYTPLYKFKILSVSFAVSKPVTTGGKAADLNLEIGTTNVTGGVVSLTSANCTPLGALVAGTAITAANTGSASDTISVEAANVTAFVEGQGYLLVRTQNMDTADAAASIVDQVNKLVADDLDNRQTITALIDDLQTADIVD